MSRDGGKDGVASRLRSQSPTHEEGVAVESTHRRVTAGLGHGFSVRVGCMSYTDASGTQLSLCEWCFQYFGKSSDALAVLDYAEV